MKRLPLLLLLVLGTPAAAQTPEPPAASVEAVDAARLALARVTVDHIWPMGTYARMMRGSIDQISDSVMVSMLDLKVGDVVPDPPEGAEPIDPELADATLREVMAKADPHFEERMRITNRVVMDEIIPVMSRLEPDVREALARAYARRFSEPQLAELNRFFATPTGTSYARESMMLFVDPEIMALMGRLAPELAKDMPRILERMEQATAHLPPPPAPKRAGRDRRGR
jgi:hypothetical protein